MAYKARRTRDLQGEVQAGTGISVTESVKPDGTKEYTITNGDPASAITVSGAGLSLIANVLSNTMAARMGWNDTDGSIDYRDDNNEPVLQIDPLDKIFLGDANLGSSFFLKQLALGANKLISGDVQIAENESSTEGVSLQTLADMVNSSAVFSFGVGNESEGTQSYAFTNGEPYAEINTIGDYYIPTTSQDFTIAGNDVGGIKILKSGLYKVSLNSFSYTVLTNNISVFNFHLIKITTNGNIELLGIEIPVIACDYNTFGFYGTCQASIDTFVELAENDILTFYGEIYDASTSLSVLGNDPKLSIQKIR